MNYLKELPPQEEQRHLPSSELSSSLASDETEFNLWDYWKVIVKRRWTIIACLLIVVAIAAVVTFTTKPIYRSTLTIQINKENAQIVDFKEVFAVNTTDTDYYQTQYKLLESRNLARRVIQTLSLSKHPEFLPRPETPFQKWKANVISFLTSFFPAPRKDASESKQESLLIDQFLGKLRVEPLRTSRLVKIHFHSNDPELSTLVTNTLAATYIKQNLENRFLTTEQAKEWLTGQLEDLKAKVEKADETLQAFGSRYDIISLEEKENVILQRLNELNETLTKAEAERMAREALYKQAKEAQLDSISPILENKLIADLKQSYIQLEAQYMRQSEQFRPEFPEMVRLKAQMEALQKRIDNEVNKILTGIKNDYEASLRRESLLRQAFEKQKAKAMEMKQNAIRYNILKREADTNKELYKGLLQRMKEAGVSAGITASNIQIVDPAEVPTRPYKPNVVLNLALAILAGLFGGLIMAFFLDHLDNSVKTPEEVEQMIRLPSFGMVPEIAYERRSRLGKAMVYPVERITFDQPKSMHSEAYRNIRTSILLSFSKQPPKKIAISSPNPGEGKTTTVVNTAIALAQTNARVLIIDADLRKPRLHHIFGNGHGAGLSSFLAGNAELESVTQKTDIPNLFYIPAGPIPPNPSELLGSDLFGDMLESLGEQFKHIIVDCPPLLSFADTLVISTFVDGVILVVSGGKTPRATLQRAKEVLYQVNAKILGVVINRVDVRQSGYGYYHYRYNYYYGREGRKKKEIPYSTEEETRST